MNNPCSDKQEFFLFMQRAIYFFHHVKKPQYNAEGFCKKGVIMT